MISGAEYNLTQIKNVRKKLCILNDEEGQLCLETYVDVNYRLIRDK